MNTDVNMYELAQMWSKSILNGFVWLQTLKFLENTTQREDRCLPKIPNANRNGKISINSPKIGPRERNFQRVRLISNFSASFD